MNTFTTVVAVAVESGRQKVPAFHMSKCPWERYRNPISSRCCAISVCVCVCVSVNRWHLVYECVFEYWLKSVLGGVDNTIKLIYKYSPFTSIVIIFN